MFRLKIAGLPDERGGQFRRQPAFGELPLPGQLDSVQPIDIDRECGADVIRAIHVDRFIVGLVCRIEGNVTAGGEATGNMTSNRLKSCERTTGQLIRMAERHHPKVFHGIHLHNGPAPYGNAERNNHVYSATKLCQTEDLFSKTRRKRRAAQRYCTNIFEGSKRHLMADVAVAGGRVKPRLFSAESATQQSPGCRPPKRPKPWVGDEENKSPARAAQTVCIALAWAFANSYPGTVDS